MKTSFVKICFATVASTLLFTASAMAGPITYIYNDTWVNWYGFSSSYGDEHGEPKVSKLHVTVDGDKLTKVQLDFTNVNQINYHSLFINTSYTTSSDLDEWDYFVRSGYASNNRSANTDGTAPGDGLYTVHDQYEYTTAKDSPGLSVRVGNPNGIDADDLSLLKVFTPTLNKKTLTYDFGEGLALYGGFFVAWSPWCANDVIGGGKQMDPIPEPTTMLLFGTGLIGLAGLARRRQKVD